MPILTRKPDGSSPASPPLWRRAVRAGLAILPALALSFVPVQASAQPAGARTVPIQHAVATGSGDLPIVNVQHYRHHGPPRYHRPHRPPPHWRGPPPRHYRGHYRPPPHWRGPPPRHYYRGARRHDPGAAIAAGAIGLAAGAILGSALTAQGAPPRSDAWLSYCASKYRSFDPRTGTYLGYDGRRHPCR